MSFLTKKKSEVEGKLPPTPPKTVELDDLREMADGDSHFFVCYNLGMVIR
jgi:hypothetical protein